MAAMVPMDQAVEVSYCMKLDLPDTKDSEDLALYSARTEQLPSARLPKKLSRPTNVAFFSMPTPAAVGILGEADEEVTDISIAVSPHNDDGEAWEAGPAPGPPGRYADKAQGLSLAQRLRQLDFSDDEDEEIQSSRHELREQEGGTALHADMADPDSVLEEGHESALVTDAGIVVEDCQEFIQEVDSDDD
ncbi:unnamed protein product [Symbiodinium natans]|uniref:Uncharacterized protein n=1 Tax=Symbiodinium natans TaxID=878477 RepID=A0A812K489_9DINO|nr:unnamed protein product [Symbiodinium natans]